MMDQLASVGVEFDEAIINRIFTRLERYYRIISGTDPTALPRTGTVDLELANAKAEIETKSGKLWAVKQIYEGNHPVRPWGLGALLKAGSIFYTLAGFDLRSPGLYKKIDPMKGIPTMAFLEDTNERIHSSVRVRLAVGGLGLNDSDVWDVPALKGRWRPKKINQEFIDPIPKTRRTWEHVKEVKEQTEAADPERQGNPSHQIELMEAAANDQRPLSGGGESTERWIWEYCGPEKDAPVERVLVEEPLGPYERQLLRLAGGKPNVYDYAQGVNVTI